MNSVRSHVHKHIGNLLALGVLSFLVVVVPQSALAQTMSIGTGQILPVLPPNTASSCVQPQVLTFVPYVYDGELNSFDISITDSSYVALAGTVGDMNIPFNLMTRHYNAAGNLLIHVDVPSTSLKNGLPLSITLLMAKGAGQPVCMTKIRTELPAVASAPATTGTAPASTATAPKTSAPKQTTATTPIKPTTGTAATTQKPSLSATSVLPGASTSAAGVLKNICANSGGAARLWLILLALYALIAGIASFGDLEKRYALQKEWVATAIVVPFLLLFALWYFAPGCRTGIWAPIVTILIGIVGLVTGFWGGSDDTNVIALPGASQK